ncbi:MAG: glycosyltransferase family 2 protein [bacterium]
MNERISVFVINYNGAKVLEDTLLCLSGLEYPDYTLSLVDDCSSDNSIGLVKEKFPDVNIIRHPVNKGPNAARNTAIKASITNLLLLVDNDIKMKPDLLNILADVKKRYPNSALCAPVIAYLENPEQIKYGGTSIHYIGASIIKRGNIKAVYNKQDPVRADVVGGGTILVDRAAALKNGLFDEDFRIGWEDGDFSYRITMAGYDCMIVPQAVVLHEKGLKGLNRAYYQIRNRWFFMLKTYSLKTLFLIMPALVIYEISLMLFMTLRRNLCIYLGANCEVIQKYGALMKKRKKVQKLRKRPDREILYSGNFTASEDVVKKGYQKTLKDLLNLMFNYYWNAVKNYV